MVALLLNGLFEWLDGGVREPGACDMAGVSLQEVERLLRSILQIELQPLHRGLDQTNAYLRDLNHLTHKTERRVDRYDERLRRFEQAHRRRSTDPADADYVYERQPVPVTPDKWVTLEQVKFLIAILSTEAAIVLFVYKIWPLIKRALAP